MVGIIAGGEKAFVRAQEGAEDYKEEARKDLEHLKEMCIRDSLWGWVFTGQSEALKACTGDTGPWPKGL